MKSEKSGAHPWATIVMFCALIGTLAPATFILPKKEFSETENRFLAEFPVPTAERISSGEFASEFETYLADHFAWRDGWVKMKTAAERLMLKTESKDIYFVKDGYLIEKHSGAFTSDTARRNIAFLSQFESIYKEQFGGRLSVMIVPNAVSILRGKLPPFASPYNEDLYLEEIQNALSAGSYFDADSVLKHHADEELFYKSDHHWKTRAALYVYQAWAAAQGFHVPKAGDFAIVTASDNFQGTTQSKLGVQTDGDTIELFLPKTEIAYTVKKGDAEAERSLYDRSALETKDKYAVYFGGNFARVHIETERKNGRAALVIKDSYANCFVPFMLGEFKSVDVVDLRYTNQKLSQTIERGGYTDILVLYNAAGFAEDRSVAKLVR